MFAVHSGWENLEMHNDASRLQKQERQGERENLEKHVWEMRGKKMKKAAWKRGRSSTIGRRLSHSTSLHSGQVVA
jgi:hypothetical protein